MVDLLIRSGSNVNALHADKRSPLHLASKKGNEKIVDALIKAGADVNHQNEFGKASLHRAVENDQEKIGKHFEIYAY